MLMRDLRSFIGGRIGFAAVSARDLVLRFASFIQSGVALLDRGSCSLGILASREAAPGSINRSMHSAGQLY
jgi:hypothetical protein